MSQDTATKDTAEAPNAKTGRVKVTIGVVFSMKEIEIEVEGQSAEIAATVQSKLADTNGTLVLVDAKGKSIVVPVDKLCYVVIHGDEAGGSIGFGF